jgi:tetratricopeptide (TPR) repeat protein
VRTFEKEYTYRASDADSKITCRAIALDQVKKLLLQEIGVYVQSTFTDKSGSGGKSNDEVREEIITLTAGVVTATVVDEKWDGKSYWLKAEIKADPTDVANSVERLRGDHQKSRELSELKARLEESNRKVTKLREELSSGKATDKKQEEYNKAVSELTSSDWVHKGYIALDLHNTTDAIFAADKDVELDAKNPKAYILAGKIYFDIGEYQKAKENSEKAIELEPNNAALYANRGLAYFKLGDNQKAKVDLEKAVAMDPTHANNYQLRGYFYFNSGDRKAGLRDLIEAVRLDPNDANANKNLGTVYSNMEEYTQAVKIFNEAIRLDPKDSQTYFNRGFAHFMLNKYKEAILDFTAAIKLNPEDGRSYYFRGTTIGGYLRDREGAISDIKTAARLGYKDARKYLDSQSIKW